MNRRMSLLIVLLVAAAIWPSTVAAQRVEHGRANILSVDWDRLTMQLKDPQGRIGTWRFDRGATVKFTDGANFFPNPSTKDLRPPMYVHYTFQNEVIESFDVVELGFQPGNEESANGRKEPGVPRSVTGSVTAYAPNVRQVEIEHNGTREAFQLTDRSDQRLNPGDRVQLRTDWSGQRELVVELRVLGRNRADEDRGGGRFGAVGRGSDTQTAEGRVVRITARGVVMQVAGAERTYSVEDSRLLSRLRAGDTVRFEWRTDRSGRMTITNVR